VAVELDTVLIRAKFSISTPAGAGSGLKPVAAVKAGSKLLFTRQLQCQLKPQPGQQVVGNDPEVQSTRNVSNEGGLKTCEPMTVFVYPGRKLGPIAVITVPEAMRQPLPLPTLSRATDKALKRGADAPCRRPAAFLFTDGPNVIYRPHQCAV
jgi:hypothetical protein